MLNVATLSGRLTKAPELRTTQSGVEVTSFTIAVDRDFKDSNGTRQTDFIDCQSWRGTAKFVADNFDKGQSITVVGRLQIRDWTDKDGNKRRNAEVVTENVYFAGDKRNSSTAPQPQQRDDDTDWF